MSGAGRMADALLRGVGGRTVLLHMPAPAVAGDDGEQTGMAIAEFRDLPLTPVVFRLVGDRGELLVSAAAVESLVGSLEFGSAGLLFATAAGVLVDGLLYLVTSVMSAEAFGSVYLYRVGVRAEAG